MRIIRIALFLLVIIFSADIPAMAEGGATFENTSSLRLGLGGLLITSEYKKMDATVLPFPLLSYEGKRFFIRGLTGGMHVFKNDMHEVSLTTSYLSQSFDASSSDSWAMRQLDNRYSTMMAGAGYSLKTAYGNVKVGISADVLGNSNGVIADVMYAYPLTLSNVHITPSVGLQWTNSQHNDYYYGVSSNESRKSGLKSYSPNSGVSPYCGLEARLVFNKSWGAFVNTKALFLSNEITDSSMVDKNMKFILGAGISYSF